MPTHKAKKIPEQDWRTHQQVLKHLWLEEKREMLGDEGVVETMKARYGFSASKSQYEARFKMWKLSKNQKKEDWELVSAVIHERERQGKKSEIYMQGKLQSPEKVRKETARYSLSIPQRLALSSAPQLPKSIAIRSPLLDKAESMLFDLPFRVFENSLFVESNRTRQEMPAWPNSPKSIDPRLTVSGGPDAEAWDYGGPMGETLEQHLSIDATSTVSTASDTWTPGSSAFSALDTALKSVMPKSIAEENTAGSSVIIPDTQLLTSPLYRLVLFSLANNYAGLGALPIEDVIHFLQKETNQKLYQLIRLAPGYTSRAIGQNLFKGAIEAGDARIVDLLLSENFADLDINQPSCFVWGERYTPIERASTLQHKDVIVCLLRYGADVNGTNREHDELYDPHHGVYEEYEPRGAFGCYVQSRPVQSTEMDPQILRKLLEAGGDVSRTTILHLIAHKNEEIVRLLFSANALQKVAEWSKWGVFHKAIDLLDDHMSIEIINIMLKVGADLNNDGPDRNNPRRVIDIAAQRGHFEVVALLMSHGASLTGNTLPCAVSSGNEDLVHFLLEKGADINSIDSLKVTPLAAAIRLQNARITKMIEEHGAFARLNDEVHITAALRAASEVGDFPFIEHLIQVGGNLHPRDLGYALTIATRNGRDEVARRLIDAGADVNAFGNRDGPPLFHALKRRNADLVHLLLDVDADANYNLTHRQTSAIVLAAEWGDHSVVKALLFAGADVDGHGEEHGSNTALAIAVKSQDRVLVQLLLDSGADVNNHMSRACDGTALEAAAENGDVSMARYLFDQGADPDDSWALGKALLQSPELFELILERYNKRYPRGRRGFGSTVLLQAIENGNGPLISKMLDRGLDANHLLETVRRFSEESVTPFGHAILKEQVNIAQSMELFLLKGCDPNSIVSQIGGEAHGQSALIRVTALLAAIGTRNISKVELLIRYGADVNFPTRGQVKRTPLQRAAEIGSMEIVELLIRNGAEVNAPAAQRSGATALQLAAIGGYIPIACALLNLKADIDAPGSKVNGRTALEGAAEHGRLDMVKVLLNVGAGLKGKDHAQFTRAIELAKDNEFSYICDMLEAQIRPEERGRELDTLTDVNGDEFMNWDLDEGGSPF